VRGEDDDEGDAMPAVTEQRGWWRWRKRMLPVPQLVPLALRLDAPFPTDSGLEAFFSLFLSFLIFSDANVRGQSDGDSVAFCRGFGVWLE
jgi:hypothetical protein